MYNDDFTSVSYAFDDPYFEYYPYYGPYYSPYFSMYYPPYYYPYWPLWGAGMPRGFGDCC